MGRAASANFYVISIINLIGFSILFSNAKGQTTLSAGDIAITKFNSQDPDDGFSFILLRNIDAGTVIRFTDRGWINKSGGHFTSSGNSTGEDTLTWVATSAMDSFEEVELYFGSPESVSSGMIINGRSLDLATGDQILAYQGNHSGSPTPTFIAALNCTGWDESNGNTSSDVPAGLTDGINAVSMSSSYANFAFDCSSFIGLTTDELRQTINNDSNWNGSSSEVYDGMPCELQSLPVELVTFIGYQAGDEILLEWVTATEKENSHFVVQKSIDEHEWIDISEVKGFSNTLEKRHYSYEDRNINGIYGVLYYRLKQIDLSGKEKYSNVISVNYTNESLKTLKAWITSQNNTNHINLSIQMPFPFFADLSLIDYKGNELHTERVELHKGINTHTIENKTPLKAGIYFLKVKTPAEVEVIKFRSE